VEARGALGRKRVLDALADHVQLALERREVGAAAAQHEELADPRHDPARGLADVLGMDRHVAPAEEVLALFGDGALET